MAFRKHNVSSGGRQFTRVARRSRETVELVRPVNQTSEIFQEKLTGRLPEIMDRFLDFIIEQFDQYLKTIDIDNLHNDVKGSTSPPVDEAEIQSFGNTILKEVKDAK